MSASVQLDDERLRRFLQWYDAAAPSQRCVAPARDAYGGWRLVATRAVAAGEELLRSSVASQCVVMGRHAAHRRLSKAGCSDRGALAAFLLLERLDAASPLAPWLAMLPAAAVGASGADADATGDGDVRAARAALTTAARSDFAAASAACRVAGFDERGFEWALGVISSRAVNAGGFKAIVPLADFANHDPTSAAAIERVDDAYYTIRAPAALAPGDEVYISYGRKPASDFLLHYGFVPLERFAAAGASAGDVARGACPTTFRVRLPLPGDERRADLLAYYGVRAAAPPALVVSTAGGGTSVRFTLCMPGTEYAADADAWAVARVSSLPDDRLPEPESSDDDDGAGALFRLEENALGAPPEDPNDLYLALLFFRRCCIAECDDDAPDRAGFRGDGGVDWPNVYAALRDAATFGAVSTLSRDASALLPMMRHDDPHLASGLNLSFNQHDFNLR